ncbi:MAG: hypothetical protein AAB567_01745 [Patescibacteria group bacterium]
MKWCFLLNDVPVFSEFLGKLANEAQEQQDQCVVLINSKIAEWSKKKYFPPQATFISKVDWCEEHWDPSLKEPEGLSWKLLFPLFDRPPHWPFDYSSSVAILSQLGQFFAHVFQKESPDVILGEPPTGAFGQLAHHFAKKLHLPIFGLTASRVEGKIACYDRFWTDSRYDQIFEELSEKEIPYQERTFLLEWMKQFLSHRVVPPYVKNKKIKFGQRELFSHYVKRLKDDGRHLLRYLRERKRWQPYDYESELVLRHSLRQPLELERRQIRLHTQQRFFQTPDLNDQFFLFPLHMQPEASTSLLAMHYSDQVNTVRNIAFCLPFPCKLYVKEHPSAAGTRSDEFYKKLKEIPHVVLLSPSEDALSLLKSCLGVITLSSTMGMEAAMMGKPTYVLGNVFYSYHPFCKKIANFDELKQQMETDRSSSLDATFLESLNLRFVASYMRNLIPQDVREENPTYHQKIMQHLKTRIEAKKP